MSNNGKYRLELMRLLRNANHEPADVWYESGFTHLPWTGWHADISGTTYFLGKKFDLAKANIEAGEITTSKYH